MKQIKFFAMLLALTMTLGFTSCSESEDGAPKSPISGSWVQTNDYGTVITLVFNDNLTGTVRYEYPNDGGGAYDVFEYFYDAEDKELTVIGDTQMAGIYDVTITAKTLILYQYTTDGIHEYRFTRI